MSEALDVIEYRIFMLIKQPLHVNKYPIPAIYILAGKDPYLMLETAKQIKHRWYITNIQDKALPSSDPISNEWYSILYIDAATDWLLLEAQANNYNLFTQNLFIDVRYEKCTLDSMAMLFLQRYLLNSNDRCLITIQTPNLTLKQLTAFINYANMHVIQIAPLSRVALQYWIQEQLEQKNLQYSTDTVNLLYRLTQGNMLACAQAIERIHLTADTASVTSELVTEQLVEQFHYELFELSDACLQQDTNLTLCQLRYAQQKGVQPIIVLWWLTQEIRNLIKLKALTMRAISLHDACEQLNIWSTRIHLYKTAVMKITEEHLIVLLQYCKIADEWIKSSRNNNHVWQLLENIALSLCLGKQVTKLA